MFELCRDDVEISTDTLSRQQKCVEMVETLGSLLQSELLTLQIGLRVQAESVDVRDQSVPERS